LLDSQVKVANRWYSAGGGFAGFLLAFYCIQKAYRGLSEAQRPELPSIEAWAGIEAGVYSIRQDMRSQEWDPDLVIGLGCGGSVVGAMLAGCLGRKRFIAIDRRFDWEHGRTRRKAYVDVPKTLALDPVPKKVVLVMGELYDSEPLKLAIDYVRSKVGGELRTAAMYVSENLDRYPDFYVHLLQERIEPAWRLAGSVRDSKRQ
jgi:hypoxanthine phosphoribosyltransferase